jgi:hypothetical protein
MMSAALGAGPRDRAKLWTAAADQAAFDAETVRRWRDHTVSAPGYRVAVLDGDSRQTVYAQWGDWFSAGCVVLAGLMGLDWLVHRLRRPRRRRRRAGASAGAAA